METADHGNSAKKRSRNQDVIDAAVDRISDLPESVLLYILSFLSARNVVRTCILSRRWQHVWPCVPSLDFDYRNFMNIEGFVNFVNRFLLQYKGGSIKKFRIEYILLDHPLDTESWIRWAINMNVEELDITFPYYPHLLLHLPQTIFGCKTLVVLKLKDHLLNMAFPPSACIPCLKILELVSVSSLDDEFEYKLISCCVVLEYLFIQRGFYDDVKNIRVHAQQLKCLNIKFREAYSKHRKGNICVIDINAPNLEDLVIEDAGSYFPLLANVGNLSKAKINLNVSNAFQSLLKCFSALKNVTSLNLSSGHTKQTWNMEPRPALQIVNLTHLTLGVRSVWVQLLPYFFQCFPNLKVLRLKKDSSVGKYAGVKLCIDPELLPTGLLSRLRVFDTEEFSETQDDLGMLKYILKNSKVLDLVKIHYISCHQINEKYSTHKGAKAREFQKKLIYCEEERCKLEQKFQVAQKIVSFPRASRKCEIKFF